MKKFLRRYKNVLLLISIIDCISSVWLWCAYAPYVMPEVCYLAAASWALLIIWLQIRNDEKREGRTEYYD